MLALAKKSNLQYKMKEVGKSFMTSDASSLNC